MVSGGEAGGDRRALGLAVDGLLGTAWFSLVVILLATGIGTIPAFGVGLGACRRRDCEAGCVVYRGTRS